MRSVETFQWQQQEKYFTRPKGKKRRKRWSAVEPKIGHLKSDHRLGRCYLKGLAGDAINVLLAAAGSNIRKLLHAILFAPIAWITCRLTDPLSRKDQLPQLANAV